MHLLRLLAVLTLAALLAVACGDSSDDAALPGIRVIDPDTGAATIADPPDDLVILDVRTPEEFAEGHIDGAIMIDFYAADFSTRLAELDPDQPYLIYCRSGNRSGQTRALLDELGFTDVADIEGGVLAWTAADHPLVTT